MLKPRHASRSPARRRWNVESTFLAAAIFIVAVGIMGGGARADIVSLLILRPAAVIALGLGIWWLTPATMREFRTVFVIFGLTVAYTAATLVPLPPALWGLLPGRSLALEAATVAGINQPWRPISLVPWRTWNALFALMVPAAALCLAAGCTADGRERLLKVVVWFAAASALFGVLQIVTSGNSALYLYRVTNDGSPVGLFANRNHQAALLNCLFPLLAGYASLTSGTERSIAIRRNAALAVAITLLPLQLITGSRAGLLLLLPAIVSALWIYRAPERDRRSRRKRAMRPALLYSLVGAGLAGLMLVTVLASRATAWERLISPDESDNTRIAMLLPNIDLGWKYFPFGSGSGTFVEIFQVDEPQALLHPSYANHAHNDLVELWITTGLAGVLLMLAGLAAWGLAVRAQLQLGWRPPLSGEARLARVGLSLIAVLAASSAADYPLRTPSLGAIFAVAAIWASWRGKSDDATAEPTTQTAGRATGI